MEGVRGGEVGHRTEPKPEVLASLRMASSWLFLSAFRACSARFWACAAVGTAGGCALLPPLPAHHTPKLVSHEEEQRRKVGLE